MRRLLSSGVALLAACLIGFPVFAGSGYSPFPEAAVGRKKPVNTDMDKDARIFFKDRFMVDKTEMEGSDRPPESKHKTDADPSGGRLEKIFVTEDSKVVAYKKETPKQAEKKKRFTRFLHSHIPWGKKKEKVTTVPKQVALIPKMVPVSPVGDAKGGSPAAGGYQQEDHEPADADYVLGIGDVLQISVWKDETLSKILPILPDGMINFPLIGRIKAEGKTIDALKHELNEEISRYVPDPFVDISVQQVNSMLIFMIGRVNQPGRYPLQGNMTVLQALAMAGGLNTFAKKDKIQIIRENENETKIFRFDYDEVVNGVNLEQNIRLKRGDIIVAP